MGVGGQGSKPVLNFVNNQTYHAAHGEHVWARDQLAWSGQDTEILCGDLALFYMQCHTDRVLRIEICSDLFLWIMNPENGLGNSD